MSKIPPELDRLMWTLAEEANDRGIEEFVVRYPAHRAELMRRSTMLRDLKGAKALPARHEVPRFTPQRHVATPPNRPLMVATACLVFAAVGLAGYVAVTARGSESKPVATQDVVPKVAEAPVQLPNPDSVVKRTNSLPNAGPPVVNPQPAPNPPIQNPMPKPEPAYLRPKDVRIANTSLLTAIALITDGSGLKVDIAPGFPDQEVSLDYVGKDTVEILQDMAQRFQFTIFEEGEGRILLVPAVQEGSSARKAGS